MLKKVLPKYPIIIIILLFIAIFFYSFFQSSNKELENKEETPKLVKAILIGDSTSKTIRKLPGVVEATNRVEMSFEVPGTLVEVNAIRGSLINKGDVIAKLDSKNYEFRLNERKAKLEELKLKFERHKRLLKKGYVSKAIYDNSKASYEVADASYKLALEKLEDTILIAPYNSVVADVYIDNYQQIVVKQPIVLLQDPEEIDIVVDIPENEFIKVKNAYNDYRFSAIFESLEASHKKKYPLKYRKHELSAHYRTQTYKLYLTMKVPENLNVLPGMTAVVEIINNEKVTDKKFYLLPSQSLFSKSEGGDFLWVIDPKTSRLKKRKIEIKDFASGEDIKVISGISKGDIVVIAGVNFLYENMLVKPINLK